jgi:hypothetical protein
MDPLNVRPEEERIALLHGFTAIDKHPSEGLHLPTNRMLGEPSRRARALEFWHAARRQGWRARYTSLAASSRRTSASLKSQPMAPRLSRSCASFRAPMITDDTAGRRNNQFSATCATEFVRSRAISANSSTIR